MAFSALSPSQIYHWIRGQTALKVYVMYNILDIADILLRKVGHYNLESISTAIYKREMGRIVMAWIQGLLYVQMHAFVLLLQLLSLFAAFNSSTTNLLTLLLSANFTEIKISLLKRVDNPTLFSFLCNDVVERVQLVMYCCIMFSQQDNNWQIILNKTAITLIAEFTVDWCKYSMFVRLSPTYAQYCLEFYNGLFVELVKSKLKYKIRAGGNKSTLFPLPHVFPRCSESLNLNLYATTMEHLFLQSKNLNFLTLPHLVLLLRFLLPVVLEAQLSWLTWGLISLNLSLLYCLIDLGLYTAALAKACFPSGEPNST